jgi:hypothetical protein
MAKITIGVTKLIGIYLKMKVMSVTGFAKDEIKIEHIKDNEYRVTMKAKGCSEETVKSIKI